jgi:hypothetical protein
MNEDVPYVGLLGRTRCEAVHVLMPDATVRSVNVYTGIDALADPALAALARAGTLHHVGHGVELALAFTYHDAAARVFVLVVPEALRHRALALRAEHMLALAEDTENPPPEYVRDVDVVVGPAGLTRRLERGAAELSLSAMELPQADKARALALREQELARRERLLDARERAVQSPSRPTALRPALAAVHESDIEELADGDDEGDDDGYEPALLDDDDDDPEAYAAHPVSGEYDEIVEIANSQEPLADDLGVELLSDDDDREDISLIAALADPPDAFALDRTLQLSIRESEGRVWLFVRGRPGTVHADDGTELLVQVDPALEPPVVLLTLIFGAQAAPEVRRGVLDPFVPEQMAALRLLGQHFEVQLVTVSGQGMEHCARLHSARESNVRAVLDQLERSGQPTREGWEHARDALLASPPPWHDLTHPFQHESAQPPLTATEAAVLLDELSEWLSPERRARVRLVLCVPDEIVDATYREAISYALDWGLALSRELAARALELGIEKDEGALLSRRIEGLCRTSRESDLGGLEEGVLRAEWSDALEHAAHLGVTLSDEARELAQKHAGERALVHAAALSDARDAALDPLRERAFREQPDIEALEQLLAEGGYRDVLEACRLAHKVPPEQAGALFARVARRGDPVALDALLSLLSFAEQPLVRAGAALALSARRALNALDTLVTHVAREAEPDYPLFALALGRYGAGSFRAIARAMKQQNVEPERVALTYAHLALHGARAQVRAKARARERADAQLAERALALASELKDRKNPVSALEQQGSLTVFCEVFDRLSRDRVG